MSMLLLFHGSSTPTVGVTWEWNGLLLPLHNPYAPVGVVAPYLPNGLALTTAAVSGKTTTAAVKTGAKSTVAIKTGSRFTLVIKSGQKDAVVL